MQLPIVRTQARNVLAGAAIGMCQRKSKREFAEPDDGAVVHSQVFRTLPEKCFEAVVNMTLASLGPIKLGERPGAELAFGLVSKPWEPAAGVPTELVTAERFVGFDEAGFAKIARAPASTGTASGSRW